MFKDIKKLHNNQMPNPQYRNAIIFNKKLKMNKLKSGPKSPIGMT